jgi:signal transduction histidine kinase
MKTFLTLLGLLTFFNTYCQNKTLDSFNNLIAKAVSDTQRINKIIEELKYLRDNDLDAAIRLSNETIREAEKITYKSGEAKLRVHLAGSYCFKGDFAAAKRNLDSAKQILAEVKDSATLSGMYNIYGMMYAMQNKFDTSVEFFEMAVKIARLANKKELLGTYLQNEAISYQQQSNFPMTLQLYQQAMDVSEEMHNEKGLAFIYLNMAIVNYQMNDKAKSLALNLKAIDLAKKFNLKNVLTYGYANIATGYGDLHQYDSQYTYCMDGAKVGREIGDLGIVASCLSRGAIALTYMGKTDEAQKLIREALLVADSSKQPYNIYQANANMGSILKSKGQYKEAIHYFEKAFGLLTQADLYNEETGTSYRELSECYEKTGNYQKALANFKLAAEISDSVTRKNNIQKATELSMNYEFEKKQQANKAEQQKKDEITKTKQTAMIIGLALLLIAAIIAFRGYKNKQQANKLLSTQKNQIEDTLKDLKNTQAQLIQSEKMASLGELTAGIAHEIQNPLNFVNNFSQINKELLDELKEAAGKGEMEEVKSLATDVIANEEKITHHGQRADAIVKGMLQHSRTSTGKKEPTDINALCNEFLKLSYHGIRARYKSFNAKFETDFDVSLPKINIVPQDIGRVLLNLFNNAFYAVNEKQKVENGDYAPAVTVVTKKLNGEVEIKVNDNGNGIPEKIKNKIFQPFFTTKPTGIGTGLGLSLSFDIVTKEHGGTIKAESPPAEATEQGKENIGTVFIINLPYT